MTAQHPTGPASPLARLLAASWVALVVLSSSCHDDSDAPTRAATGATRSNSTSAFAASSPTASASASLARLPTEKLARPDAWGALPAARLLTERELPIYRIDQQIDDEAGTFAGTLHIDYPNPTGRELSELPLLLHPNSSRELGVAHEQAGSLTVKSVEYDKPRGGTLTVERKRPTLLVAALDPPVAADARVKLVVHYQGTFRRLGPGANDMFAQALGSMGSLTAGAGAADYGLLALGDGILTAASAYPMVAPFRDGGFDTGPPVRFGDLAYNQVARFEVHTVVPEGLAIVTNLIDSSPAPTAAGKQVVASAGSFVRDFVLVAGRDLKRTTRPHGSVRVTSVYRAQDERAGRVALDTAVAALAAFERRFGPYPYTELDVVEASLVGGAGGVEFSGMVLIAGMLYRRPEDSRHPMALLLKLMGGMGSGRGGGFWSLFGFDSPVPPALPADAPSSRQPAAAARTARQQAPDPSKVMSDLLAGALEFTVAHEVAHQYFAGVVGNDSHRFPSLDEPIAQYAAGLVVADMHGPAAAEAAMNANVKMNYAMYRLLGGADRPVLRDVDSFQTPVEYAGLVYGKAPYLYVALEKKLGERRLHEAIHNAVGHYRFQLVTTEQWITALEKAAGGPSSGVRNVFRRYLDQAHGDADLGVDESGDFVLDAIYGPALAAQVRQSFAMLGMRPRDVFRMSLGGVAEAPPGSTAAPTASQPAPRAGPPLPAPRHTAAPVSP